MERTPEQRRAYIETSRRLQPHHELERKAHKASGRSYSGVERTDMIFARHHGWDAAQRPRFNATFRLTFCGLCHKFAPAVGALVEHTPRCNANPIDDRPCPGWTAAGGRPANLPAIPVIPSAPRTASDRERSYGTPISRLSGRPGHPGFDEFCRIAQSWGYD